MIITNYFKFLSCFAIFLMTISIFATNCFSQDLLMLKDGTSLSVHIIKIEGDKVFYKMAYEDGASVQTMYKKQIEAITDQEGRIVPFNNEENSHKKDENIYNKNKQDDFQTPTPTPIHNYNNSKNQNQNNYQPTTQPTTQNYSSFNSSSNTHQGFNISIIAVPGLSLLLEDWVDNYSKKKYEKQLTFGFEGGVNCGYNFTNQFGLSAGLHFAKLGQNYKDLDVSSSSSYSDILSRKLSLTYLKVPILFDFAINPDAKIAFAGFAGFYMGLLAGYEDNYTETDSYGTSSLITTGNSTTITGYSGNSKQYDLESKPWKDDYGITFGVGFQSNLSENLSLQIMLSEQMGFDDVKNVTSQVRDGNDLENFYNSSDKNRLEKHRNNLLGLLIGVKINL